MLWRDKHAKVVRKVVVDDSDVNDADAEDAGGDKRCDWRGVMWLEEDACDEDGGVLCERRGEELEADLGGGAKDGEG